MDFLKKLFGGGSETGSSAQAARRRLLEVVVHDRAELPPGIVELIRDDIVAVVSRRIKIDRDQVTVNINNHGSTSVVSVDVPLLGDQLRGTQVGAQGGSPSNPASNAPSGSAGGSTGGQTSRPGARSAGKPGAAPRPSSGGQARRKPNR